MEGLLLDCNKHFNVVFGEHMHACEGTTNDMQKRTVAAFVLGPSGNLQGGVRCHSLVTGKVIHRIMPDVTQMKMSEDAKRRLSFTSAPMAP